MRDDGLLTLAAPRGALFADTLALIDGLGADTAALRSGDRRLIFTGDAFAAAGLASIVTMRPSDVPTYVERGAADVGITGKDVLLE